MIRLCATAVQQSREQQRTAAAEQHLLVLHDELLYHEHDEKIRDFGWANPHTDAWGCGTYY
jgi:hypothetical protein